MDGSGWIPAGSLDTSDRLLSADGTDIRIKDIWVENLEETITVYNFQVEDYHTYYVGDTQILVHNTCSAGDVAGTIGENSSTNAQTYYQVTSSENARALINSSNPELIGTEFKEIYVWTKQPTLIQAQNSGARYLDTVIEFKTSATFSPDNSIQDSTLLNMNIARVSDRPGPISISNVVEVGFASKKRWWQFWKK